MMRTLMMIGCVTLAGAGCGGPDGACERACEEANDCSGAGEDCAAQCAEFEEFGQKSGCAGVFEDLFACYEANDVCSLSILENCSDEISATITCQVEYCSENPDDSICQSGI